MDIGQLSSLLNESREAQESISSKSTQPPQFTDPTLIKTGNSNAAQKKKIDSKSIWGEEEIPSEDSFVDQFDKRPTPRYEFCYKQSVGTEDTFLGLSDKTPLSSDCTHLVVKVHFPSCTMKDIDLKVTSQRITAQSKQHKLSTYLPVKVDETNGNAKFDPKKEVLTVTLPIVNEF